MNVRRLVSPFLLLMLAGAFAGPASASLATFKTFIGKVGYSSDGFASTGQTGTISAKVPAGSTVLAAYLYTATFNTTSTSGDGTTLNGTAVSFGSPVLNTDACCTLGSRRADVTSIIKPIIDGGAGGVYDFNVSETAGNQDGESLVVVYSNPSLSESTFAILDGFARTTGDTTKISFANPLDPSDPGFFAEMFLGDGFSFDESNCSTSEQVSTVKVNGTVITDNAGCNDDSIDAAAANGNLLTTGGFDDPFSPMLPTTAEDHERYNLVPQINMGDKSIVVDTVNASENDNIFLAGFYVSGVASIGPPPSGVPEPSNLALFGVGALGLWLLKRRFNPLVRR